MVPVCPRGASWGRYASVEGNTSHIGTTSPCRAPGGRLADAMNPEIQCARTHWIQGFMTFQLVRRIQTVMLMVPVCPKRAQAPRPDACSSNWTQVRPNG